MYVSNWKMLHKLLKCCTLNILAYTETARFHKEFYLKISSKLPWRVFFYTTKKISVLTLCHRASVVQKTPKQRRLSRVKKSLTTDYIISYIYPIQIALWEIYK